MLSRQSEGLDVLQKKHYKVLNFDNFCPQGRSYSTRSYIALNTHHSGIPEQQQQLQQQQQYNNKNNGDNKINNNSNNNNNIYNNNKIVIIAIVIIIIIKIIT